MPILQLIILGAAAMLGLALSRLVLDRLDQAPLEGIRGFLALLAFLVVPPVAFSVLFDRAAGSVGAIVMVPLYAIVLGALVTLMWSGAQLVRIVARGRARPLLLLALVGHKGESDDVPFDPPVTQKLAASVALVDRANGVFPRGPEFAAQVERAGFRFGWDALDAATRTLEAGIADDRRLGLPVASSADATAKDARSRLDTLQRLAADHAQSWAVTA